MPPTTPIQLPLAERMAARLDGEAFSLGDAHFPVDEIETPALRVAGVLAGWPPRFIAELGTAAWVWGATVIPPTRLEVCVDLRARARPQAVPFAAIREVVLRAEETRMLGGRRVTTPLRTATDLARARDAFGEADDQVVRALAAIGGFGFDDCVASMNARRNLPAKRRATERLRAALS